MEEGKWIVTALEDEDGAARMYKLMEVFPPSIDATQFSENISIKWQFSEDSMPNETVLAELNEFEDLIETLDDSGKNSFVVFIYTGYGQREWSYQAKRYETFL